MKVRRIVAVGSAMVVAAVAGSLAAIRQWQQHSNEQIYQTEAIDRGNIVASVTATGSVHPVTVVEVGTYVSGRIVAIDVDFNSPVRKNQRVAKIDPAPFAVKVRKAEANLLSARANLQKSRVDLEHKRSVFERYRRLYEQALVAENDFDVARTDYERAKAQVALVEAAVAQAAAELEDAQVNLGYTDIVSPVDGVVVARNVSVGQTVAASFQTPTLFLIAADLTQMQLNAAVSESDIGQVREGQEVAFTVDAYGERTFHGKVEQVRHAPNVVQNVVTYDVVIRVENPDLALKPGMTATVTILTGKREAVVRVPMRALRFRPERAASHREIEPSAEHRVWVLRKGKIEPVAVTLGLRNELYAELLAGDLAVGERVVTGTLRETRKGSQSTAFPGPVRLR